MRAAAGHYDLESPQHLVKLLVAITRNKVAHQARREHRQRRDLRRRASEDVGEVAVAARSDSPSTCVAGAELLDTFRRRLTDEERTLADLRSNNHSWESIAEHLGGTPQARRKQLARAIDRVSKELGLDD